MPAISITASSARPIGMRTAVVEPHEITVRVSYLRTQNCRKALASLVVFGRAIRADSGQIDSEHHGREGLVGRDGGAGDLGS
ncbi:hypothetical protein [Mycobacteroides abscessus]|uniref:hypothetical protein n=1 Tax=Mycobacteroides abscessus TaxID=36809 RepID=UPI00266EF51D|nr:hypothetical protein [Mycobacteroides abscessus]MDO3107052.1 hypothetical protein [Mycobacteroides abscessus subsp. abscessus]